MSKKRTLTVKRRSDGFVSMTIDVTGWLEHRINGTIAGLLINTDINEWGVYDSHWGVDLMVDPSP